MKQIVLTAVETQSIAHHRMSLYSDEYHCVVLSYSSEISSLSERVLHYMAQSDVSLPFSFKNNFITTLLNARNNYFQRKLTECLNNSRNKWKALTLWPKMANARIIVFNNNYLTQLQIKWSLDQTRDIAQCKTIAKNLNFNSKQSPKQI